jgi:predicted O-linked N-acetylglucosamine transferase (SPINDLY family)
MDLSNQKILYSHHWSHTRQRNPIFSKDEIYITSSKDQGEKVVNLPIGINYDVKKLLDKYYPNWCPDLFVAKVDSFFTLVPRNVKALDCPKILILGDTQHGLKPLERMIEYAKSEPYDFYISDHKRHHLWYYHLAGIRNLYWLPGLFLNPLADFSEPLMFQDKRIPSNFFQDKVIFVGQAGKHHPRRRAILKYLRTQIPSFWSGGLLQQDSLKAFSQAPISLNISLNGDLNLRCFEVISSKGFLLTDALSEESGIDLLFSQGQEYESFRSINQLVNKIKYFLKYPDTIEQYKQKAYQKYLNNFTPAHLKQSLQNILEGNAVNEIYTLNTLARVNYFINSKFSETRIKVYQIIQDLHKKYEVLKIFINGDSKFIYVEDLLDLPRLTIFLVEYSIENTKKLTSYLAKSKSFHKIHLLDDCYNYDYDVLVVNKIELPTLLQSEKENFIIISDDKKGVENLKNILDEQEKSLTVNLDYYSEFFVMNVNRNPLEGVDASQKGKDSADTTIVTNSGSSMKNIYSSEKRGFKSEKPSKKKNPLKKQAEIGQNVAKIKDLFHKALNYSSEGKTDQAIESYQAILELDPNSFPALINLGNIFKDRGKYQDALDMYEKALAIPEKLEEEQVKLKQARVHNNIANIYKDRGQNAEAIEHFRLAVKFDPSLSMAQSNLLFSLNYSNSYRPEEIYQQHINWREFQGMGSSQPIPTHNNDRNPERKLKVGFISKDFGFHSVSYFFGSVLASHNRQDFAMICYSNNPKADNLTQILQNFADGWRQIDKLTDEEVVEMIRQDEIDILIDLSGHTAGNRILVFARKPAPIQVSYLGYPNTTGLTTMDYRITDAWADPPGTTEHLYTEKLIRLPYGFLCYKAPSNAPSVNPPPLLSNGYLTFGSFNNLAKVNPELVGYWAQILQAFPNSKMIIKSKPLADDKTKAFLGGLFQQQGIDVNRVEMIGRIPNPIEHLALYNRVDIGLDTFPYHGTTTTCEALWMGVPVITLAGKSHVSRVGVSLLSWVGLPSLITHSPTEYIQKAIALGNNPSQLQKLRSNLREAMQKSPLTNGSLFSQSFENALRNMWQNYLSAQT